MCIRDRANGNKSNAKKSRFCPNRNLTGTIYHWSVILRSLSVVLNPVKRDANGFFKVFLPSSHLLISRHPVQKSKFGACAVTGYCSFKTYPHLALIFISTKQWKKIFGQGRITRDEIMTDYNTKGVNVDAYQRRDNNSETADEQFISKALLGSILSVVEKASLVICNGQFSFSQRTSQVEPSPLLLKSPTLPWKNRQQTASWSFSWRFFLKTVLRPTFIWRGNSRDFVSRFSCRLAASRPKKLTPLANTLVKLDSAVVSMGFSGALSLSLIHIWRCRRAI